jgi:hypothetical protein
MGNAYDIFVGKPERKRLLGRPRRRRENNIRIDLREIRWRCELDTSGSGQGPMAGPCEHGVMNLRVP